MFCNQRGDLGAALVDRQFGREFRPRQILAASGHAGAGFLQQLVVLNLQRLLLLAVQMAQVALHRGEAAGIGSEDVRGHWLAAVRVCVF